MNKKQTSWLALSCLVLGQAACAVGTARAGDFDVKDSGTGKEVQTPLGEGNFGRQKFTLTFDARAGYDDNTTGRPDTALFPVVVTNAAGQPAIAYRRQDVDTDGSAFVNFALNVGYTAANPRTTFTIGGDVGVSYYFDRPGRDYDVNGGLSARLTYKLTPRAFLDLSTYNTYVPAGNYGATNLSGFNGGNGVNPGFSGTSDARNSDYFYTTDRIALSYQFAPRFSAVFSENIVAFAYDENLYSRAQDRIESYSGAELQYLLQPNLTLAGTYRFGYVDYFNVDNNSQNHFVLGGVDYSFSQRLRAGFRAGVQIRTYDDAVGDETSPYYEASVTYDINKNAHVDLSSRYSIEEGVLYTNGNSKTNTFRIGTSYSQNFTARISGYVGFYYTHAEYSTLTQQNITVGVVNNSLQNSTLPNFNEDSYDVSAGLRFAINRHLSAEFGYTHTTFDSQVSELIDRSYDRNRYFGGFRVAF